MKKAAKYLSIIMAVVFLLSTLAACGKTSNGETTGNESTNEEVVTTESGVSTTKPQEKVTLNVLLPGDESKRMTEFLDSEFKQKMLDELNLEINVQYASWSAYWQKLDLMLASGEPLDFYWDVYLPKHVSKQECIPLDDLLNQYGTDIKRVTPEQNFKSFTVNGNIYAIPCQNASQGDAMNTILARTDILSSVGITKIETAKELLDASQKIKEKYPDIIPFSGIFPRMLLRDKDISGGKDLRFTINDLLYIDESEEGNTVYSLMDNKELVKSMYDFTKQLVDKNYLAEQTLTEPDNDIARFQSGKYAFVNGAITRPMELIGAITKNEPDAVLREFILNPSAPKYTGGPGSNAFYISPNSENPERVVQFLNWIWSNQDNYNFAIYGVEGKDYTIDGNNRIVQTNTDSLWYEWMFRNNEYIMFPTNVSDEFIDDYKNWDVNTKPAKLYGFSFNQEPVKSESAKLDSELKSKVIPLLNGYIDFDKHYDEILADLKSSGLDEFIAEVQKQVDAYMATK